MSNLLSKHMETSEIPHQSNPHQILSPAPDLQHLKIFVGRWHLEGQNLIGAPIGADLPVTGEQVYEWFSGNFFLLSRWERRFGDGSHLGMGVICYDTASHLFSSSNYDNLGYCRTYKLHQELGIWKINGTSERATIEFSADGRRYVEYWEISEDGDSWTPLCRLEGSKE